jgi:L-iditol 2-dehydrogenase
MFGAALVRAVTVGHPKLSPPMVLGTLIAGEVAETGADIDPALRGHRVTVDPHPPCGHCEVCDDGQQQLCTKGFRIEPGAHAQFARLRPPASEHLITIDGTLDFAEAMLAEIVACVLAALQAAGDLTGRTVLIIGCGPAGLIAIQLARWLGADHIWCTVNHPDRAHLVADYGAEPIAPTPDTSNNAHVVVEAVGRAATYRAAVERVRPGGVVIGFGGCPPDTTLTLDVNRLHYNGIRFIGSYHYPPRTFGQALGLIQDRTVDLTALLTHRIALSDIDRAPRIASSPQCLVPVIEP